MKTELTTPKAILIGMSLIAVAIASIPYSKSVVSEAHAHVTKEAHAHVIKERPHTPTQSNCM
jgi:hypothetical protein